MAQMNYARESGVNCRLMIWIAQHDAAGAVTGRVKLKEIFKEKVLYVGDGAGLLELLRDRVNANDEVDNQITGQPSGQRYITKKKAKKVEGLIEDYLEQIPATSARLTMADLIEGLGGADTELQRLLHDFLRIGVYWPSNHVKEDERYVVAQTLRQDPFWNTLLINDNADARTLADIGYAELFTTAAADLTNGTNPRPTHNAKEAIRFLRENGVVRHHRGRPHAADPRKPTLAPIEFTGARSYMFSMLSAGPYQMLETGNAKCCNAGACTASIYPYKYCEPVGAPGTPCNSMSDPCP